jgi:hypothetical protein
MKTQTAARPSHETSATRTRRWLTALSSLLLLPALAVAAPAGGCPRQAQAPEGTPIRMEICAGNAQQAVVGQPFEQALVVRLTDAVLPTHGPAGTSLVGVPIQFQVIPGRNGAGATPALVEVATDGDGIAAVSLQANSVPGPFTVRAQALGKGFANANAAFSLQNLPGGSSPQPAKPVPALSLSSLVLLVLGLLLLLPYVAPRP